MKLLLVAALAAVVLPSMAAEAGPDHPAAPVPPPVYQSVFPDATGAPAADAPDWKNANAEVARFPRGHVDLLRWERAQAPDRRHQGVPALRPEAAPAAPRDATPLPHRHH